MMAETLVRSLAMRKVARAAALFAVTVDLVAASLDYGDETIRIALGHAAFVTALALVPCALAFVLAVAEQFRRPARIGRHAADTMRLPIVVPRPYVGAAVLGGIATLAAMGEGFGLYIFLAGIALIALALSQAAPRRPLGR
jgi:hypothetical protein